jgi:hypothetical protein
VLHYDFVKKMSVGWKPSSDFKEFDFLNTISSIATSENYIAIIDSERTGDSFFNNWANNIGVVIRNLKTGEIEASIDLKIKAFVDSTWCSEKISNFWEKYSGPFEFREKILSEENSANFKIEPLKKCMSDFVEFLKKWDEKSNKKLIIGVDHPEIDVTWLNFYLNICGFPMVSFLFGSEFRPIISIFSYNMGLSMTSFDNYAFFLKNYKKNFNSLEAVYQTLGIPWRNHGEKHHLAVEDATRISLNVYEVERYLQYIKYMGIIDNFSYYARSAFHYFGSHCQQYPSNPMFHGIQQPIHPSNFHQQHTDQKHNPPVIPNMVQPLKQEKEEDDNVEIFAKPTKEDVPPKKLSWAAAATLHKK